AIDLLSPAAAALSVAHAQGISHRDIKPGNLFLTRSLTFAAGAPAGPAPTMKVVDFGVAKVFEASLTMSQSNRSGGGIHAFTPQYAAPEQFNERYGPTGPWTDVYAMALVLIELVAGRPALVGSDVMKLYVASCDPKVRPSLAASGVAAGAAI